MRGEIQSALDPVPSVNSNITTDNGKRINFHLQVKPFFIVKGLGIIIIQQIKKYLDICTSKRIF